MSTKQENIRRMEELLRRARNSSEVQPYVEGIVSSPSRDPDTYAVLNVLLTKNFDDAVSAMGMGITQAESRIRSALKQVPSELLPPADVMWEKGFGCFEGTYYTIPATFLNDTNLQNLHKKIPEVMRESWKKILSIYAAGPRAPIRIPTRALYFCLSELSAGIPEAQDFHCEVKSLNQDMEKADLRRANELITLARQAIALLNGEQIVVDVKPLASISAKNESNQSGNENGDPALEDLSPQQRAVVLANLAEDSSIISGMQMEHSDIVCFKIGLLKSVSETEKSQLMENIYRQTRRSAGFIRREIIPATNDKYVIYAFFKDIDEDNFKEEAVINWIEKAQGRHDLIDSITPSSRDETLRLAENFGVIKADEIAPPLNGYSNGPANGQKANGISATYGFATGLSNAVDDKAPRLAEKEGTPYDRIMRLRAEIKDGRKVNPNDLHYYIR